MKTHIFPAIKLTLLLVILLCGVYTLIVLGIAKAAPGAGKGEIINENGKYYYANIGQSFTSDAYFCSRPSAVGYNASGSGGSNKGPSNEEYLATVSARIDTFLVHNPDVSKSDIPVDLVTASGSGLDPDISVAAAQVQVKRIAKLRNVSSQAVMTLIDQQIQKPFLGISGPQKINVLKLNLALDKLK